MKHLLLTTIAAVVLVVLKTSEILEPVGITQKKFFHQGAGL